MMPGETSVRFIPADDEMSYTISAHQMQQAWLQRCVGGYQNSGSSPIGENMLSNPTQKARNEAEKHRRDRINSGINAICDLVTPVYQPRQQRKIDKITTLRLAANYMRNATMGSYVSSLIRKRKSSMPKEIVSALHQYVDDAGFWITINRAGKIIDVSGGIEDVLGYSLVDVANETMDRFVDPVQRNQLFTEQMLGYPAGCTEAVKRNMVLLMIPKPSGRREGPRTSVPVRLRGFLGPISTLLNHCPSIIAESGHEQSAGDEVVFMGRASPATGLTPLSLESRPDDEFFLYLKADATIVESDSRISLSAGFLPAEVINRSAHAFLHEDDVVFCAVRQGLMFLFPGRFDTSSARLRCSDGGWMHVYARGHVPPDTVSPPSSRALFYFATRQTVITAEAALKTRQAEMDELQEFFNSASSDHGVLERIGPVLDLILGPVQTRLTQTLEQTRIQYSDPFSAEFTACLLQSLARFQRHYWSVSRRPPPVVSPQPLCDVIRRSALGDVSRLQCPAVTTTVLPPGGRFHNHSVGPSHALLPLTGLENLSYIFPQRPLGTKLVKDLTLATWTGHGSPPCQDQVSLVDSSSKSARELATGVHASILSPEQRRMPANSSASPTAESVKSALWASATDSCNLYAPVFCNSSSSALCNALPQSVHYTSVETGQSGSGTFNRICYKGGPALATRPLQISPGVSVLNQGYGQMMQEDSQNFGADGASVFSSDSSCNSSPVSQDDRTVPGSMLEDTESSLEEILGDGMSIIPQLIPDLLSFDEPIGFKHERLVAAGSLVDMSTVNYGYRQ